MTSDEYIKNRLDDQISWYDKNSGTNQFKYKSLCILEIVAAAIIPFLSGMGDKVPYGAWIIGILGALIAVATAISTLSKYHENWIQYRSSSEALKKEKYLFSTKSAPYTPYNTDEAFNLLVQRVEDIICTENANWLKSIGTKQNQQA